MVGAWVGRSAAGSDAWDDRVGAATSLVEQRGQTVDDRAGARGQSSNRPGWSFAH
jgi:hypothetical protein